VQAAHLGWRIVEVPVPLIYLDEERSFGGSLDDGRKRMEYYHRVMDTAIDALEKRPLAGHAAVDGLSEAGDANDYDRVLDNPEHAFKEPASETPPTAAGCNCC
jgi:hypothetical protein